MKFTIEIVVISTMLALVSLVTATGQVCPETQACTALSVLFDKHVIHHANFAEVGHGLCSTGHQSFGAYLKACASHIESSMDIEQGIVTTPAYDAFNQYCNAGPRHYDLAWFVQSGQTLTNEFGLSIALPNGTLVESEIFVDPPTGSVQQGNPDARGCYCDGGRCNKLHSLWSSCAPSGASDFQIGRCVCQSNTMLYYLHECFTCALEHPPQGPSYDNYTRELPRGSFAEGSVLSSYSGLCGEYWGGVSNTFNISEWVYGLSFYSDNFGVVFPNGTRYAEPSSNVARAIGFTTSSALESTSTTTSFTTMSSITTLSSTQTSTSTLSWSSSSSGTLGTVSSVSSSTIQSISTGSSALSSSSTSYTTSTTLSSSSVLVTSSTPLSISSAPISSGSTVIIFSTSTFTDDSTTSTSTVFNTHTSTVVLTIFDSTSSSVSKTPSDAFMGLVTGVVASSNDALSGSSTVPSTVTMTLKTTTTIHVSLVAGSTCIAPSTTTITIYGSATPVHKHVPSGTTSAEMNDALTASSLSSMPGGGLQGFQLPTGIPLKASTIAASSTTNTTYNVPSNPPIPLQTGGSIQLGTSLIVAAIMVPVLHLLV